MTTDMPTDQIGEEILAAVKSAAEKYVRRLAALAGVEVRGLQLLWDPLTPMELEVLRGMSFGLSNAVIGRTMLAGCTENTVKTHARHLFAKLRAYDRAHAVRLGFEYGLLTLGEQAPSATTPSQWRRDW